VNTNPTAKLADNPDASSYARAGFAWATQGHLDLMRKQLSNLSHAHLIEASMNAAIYLNAAMDLADAKGSLARRLADPCAYCGRIDCTDRWTHARYDAGNETTWHRRANP